MNQCGVSEESTQTTDNTVVRSSNQGWRWRQPEGPTAHCAPDRLLELLDSWTESHRYVPRVAPLALKKQRERVNGESKALGEDLRSNRVRIPFEYAGLRRVYAGFLGQLAEPSAIRGAEYRAW